MVSKEAVRRIGIERCQSRIETEPCRAIRTGDRVRLAHIDVDVRVILWRGHADALEFPHPDADFRDAAVVPELWIPAAAPCQRKVVEHGAHSGASARRKKSPAARRGRLRKPQQEPLARRKSASRSLVGQAGQAPPRRLYHARRRSAKASAPPRRVQRSSRHAAGHRMLRSATATPARRH
jgi:hypothetical protein